MSERIRQILETSPTVAVLGAHHEAHRAAFYVPQYLFERGYRILAVNPKLVGMELWGQTVVEKLTDLDDAVDLVDVFRAPSKVASHIPEILAMNPAPSVVWLQLGIRSQAVRQAMEGAGIECVQNRCTLADHRAMGITKQPSKPA